MIDIPILLDNLNELASKKVQEKLWLYGDENQISSFTEAICGVFDDARLTRSLETGYLTDNFSIDLCQKVKRLNQVISLISEDLSPLQIINHPNMVEVRELSRELLTLFQAEVNSPNTPINK